VSGDENVQSDEQKWYDFVQYGAQILLPDFIADWKTFLRNYILEDRKTTIYSVIYFTASLPSAREIKSPQVRELHR
jgi:hypothetical protein